MKDIIKIIQGELFQLQDLQYKEFQSKLMPTVAKDDVIGVRIPVLRKYAKTIGKERPELAQAFLKVLPHRYFEENNLHAFLIENMKDYTMCIRAVKEFLPYVDNWATCDMMSPKIFKKHLNEVEQECVNWMQSTETYTIRYGIEQLMNYFLDDLFNEKYLELVAAVQSEEYYVNMMIAWYFATALAKQWDATVILLERMQLEKWIHNKTIQKAIESRRVSEEQKGYLRSLKIK